MDNQQKTPVWYWIVSGLAFLWNIMGISAFYMQMTLTEEMMAMMDPAERTLYESIPTWATIAFATAVIAGTIGTIGLLLRKKWAYPVFLLSLIGVVVQQTYIFFISGMMKDAAATDIVMPVVILLIAILLLFFSKRMMKQGWIK